MLWSEEKNLKFVTIEIVERISIMRKIQFFVLIEALLLTMAFITIVAGDFSRLVLVSVLFLLLLYYYLGKQRGNFFLVTASILLFLIIMLNPYVIAAILFAVVYGLIVASPYMYKVYSLILQRFRIVSATHTFIEIRFEHISRAGNTL